MNKYLEKIAGNQEHTRPNRKVGLGHAFAAATVGGIGASAITSPIVHTLREKVNSYINNAKMSESDMGTIRKFIKDNKLKVKFDKGQFGGLGPHYHPLFNHVGGVRVHENGKYKPIGNKDIIMHELGHAKDFSKFRKLKLAQGIAGGNLGHGIAGLASMGMLSNEKSRDYAPAVAAVPGLITLSQEGKANYHAYQGIKAHKGVSAANRFVRKTLPAQMGNYAVMGAAPVLGTYLGAKLLDKYQNRS